MKQNHSFTEESSHNLNNKQIELHELESLGREAHMTSSQGRTSGGDADFNNRQMSTLKKELHGDPNELSGLMSSPGLCGKNSYLAKQDDIMTNFLANLKMQDVNQGEQDTLMNSLQFSQLPTH